MKRITETEELIMGVGGGSTVNSDIFVECGMELNETKVDEYQCSPV